MELPLPDADLRQATHNPFQTALVLILFNKWPQSQEATFKGVNLRVQPLAEKSLKAQVSPFYGFPLFTFVKSTASENKLWIIKTQFLHNDTFIPVDDYWDPVSSKTENLNRGHASIYRLMTLKGNVHSEINWKISVEKEKKYYLSEAILFHRQKYFIIYSSCKRQKSISMHCNTQL